MNQISESIKPLFHYSYKNQAIILDSQYNFEGSVLAVSNSHGYIYFYNTQGDQPTRQHYFFIAQEVQTQTKNINAIIKIAWSMPSLNLFATSSISQTVTLYKVIPKSSVECFKNISVDSIPVSLAFCPIEQECILAVGLSDGQISLYNNQLQLIFKIQAHLEVVNSLAWQINLLDLKRNKWVINNFLNQQKNQQKSYPALLSGSNDLHIILWQFKNNKLTQISKVKAHQKPIRQVQWKPNLLKTDERIIVSCSQDKNVKIWSLKTVKNKIVFIQKARSPMKGPVYKAQFNNRGNLLAVSYCIQEQQKVETRIYKENNGALLQQMKISN